MGAVSALLRRRQGVLLVCGRSSFLLQCLLSLSLSLSLSHNLLLTLIFSLSFYLSHPAWVPCPRCSGVVRACCWCSACWPASTSPAAPVRNNNNDNLFIYTA